MSDDFTDAEAHAALDEVERPITDAEINAFLRDCERLVRSLTTGLRPRRGPDDEPPHVRPRPPLRYTGPGQEDNYSLILRSERDIDNINADPAFWGLGVSSPMLRHEQEWLSKITLEARGTYHIETKQPIFRQGSIIGVMWKGELRLEGDRFRWTMLHYADQPATICYISGFGRRIFPVKIW